MFRELRADVLSTMEALSPDRALAGSMAKPSNFPIILIAAAAEIPKVVTIAAIILGGLAFGDAKTANLKIKNKIPLFSIKDGQNHTVSLE